MRRSVSAFASELAKSGNEHEEASSNAFPIWVNKCRQFCAVLRNFAQFCLASRGNIASYAKLMWAADFKVNHLSQSWRRTEWRTGRSTRHRRLFVNETLALYTERWRRILDDFRGTSIEFYRFIFSYVFDFCCNVDGSLEWWLLVRYYAFLPLHFTPIHLRFLHYRLQVRRQPCYRWRNQKCLTRSCDSRKDKWHESKGFKGRNAAEGVISQARKQLWNQLPQLVLSQVVTRNTRTNECSFGSPTMRWFARNEKVQECIWVWFSLVFLSCVAFGWSKRFCSASTAGVGVFFSPFWAFYGVLRPRKAHSPRVRCITYGEIAQDDASPSGSMWFRYVSMFLFFWRWIGWAFVEFAYNTDCPAVSSKSSNAFCSALQALEEGTERDARYPGELW